MMTKASSIDYNVIKGPVITEKSTGERMNYNKYSFFVSPQATKGKIKEAVSEVFSVKVKNVHTLSVRPKLKRMGKYEGFTPKRKKAIVTLHEGERIKLMEGL